MTYLISTEPIESRDARMAAHQQNKWWIKNGCKQKRLEFLFEYVEEDLTSKVYFLVIGSDEKPSKKDLRTFLDETGLSKFRIEYSLSDDETRELFRKFIKGQGNHFDRIAEDAVKGDFPSQQWFYSEIHDIYYAVNLEDNLSIPARDAYQIIRNRVNKLNKLHILQFLDRCATLNGAAVFIETTERRKLLINLDATNIFIDALEFDDLEQIGATALFQFRKQGRTGIMDGVSRKILVKAKYLPI